MMARIHFIIILYLYIVNANGNNLTPNVLNKSEAENHCIVVNKKNGQKYDLTELAARDFWEYQDSHEIDRVYLLAICHNIRNVKGCEDSGICYTKSKSAENRTFTSAGRYSDAQPTIMDKDTLLISLKNGSSCQFGGTTLQHETEIYLNCPSSSRLETNGPVLMSSFKCHQVFVWMTLAACHEEVIVNTDSCIMSFSNSAFGLNLHSLKSLNFYTVNGDNKTFEINICGVIENGKCNGKVSVCDVSKPSPKVLAITGQEQFKWYNGSLILQYLPDEKNNSVNINLHCSRSDFNPRFYYNGYSNGMYNFSVYTVNVCLPKSMSCLIQDKDFNIINLNPLRKSTGNYEIMLSGSNTENATIHFNICGPLNDQEALNCSYGIVGACMVQNKPRVSKNLGYITSDPKVNRDGSITILYTGGPNCSESSPIPISTRITFVCSSFQMGPLIGSVMGCQYTMLWYTPSACPLGKTTGENCVVEDTLYGHRFDLNPLRNKERDYETSDGEKSFRLNVCGPLVKPCENSTSDTSVCQITPDGQRNGGSSSGGELTFNDGTLIMKFGGGDTCNENQNWSSMVLILCSHSAANSSDQPQYIHTDLSCTHYFMWPTPVACPPFEVTDCSVVDGMYKFDLGPLSNSKMNEVYIDSEKKRKFNINVCRSVVHSKEARCAYDAGACVKSEEDTANVNIGKVQSGPYIKNGILKIKYENGDICNGSILYSTLLEFICTPTSDFSYPILLSEENCVFVFKYFTPHACPRVLTDEIDQSGNCTVSIGGSNHQISLEYLPQSELKINDTHRLVINVCQKVRDIRCQEGVGACVVSEQGSLSAGRYNKNIKSQKLTPYLEYTDGEETCQNKLKRHTKIEFLCHYPGLQYYGPVLASADSFSCTYIVHWYTELACPKSFKCIAEDWQRAVNLSPLISNENYIVPHPTDPDTSYAINVCNSIYPIGTHCAPGPSACSIKSGSEDYLSLGWSLDPPTFVEDSKIQLMYTKGSRCPQNPDFTITSKIIFICNETAGMGAPTFSRDTADCTVEFEWQTGLACPKPKLKENECVIRRPDLSDSVDLSVLRASEPYKVQYGSKTFLINVCGGRACDNGAAVCVDRSREYYGDSDHFALKWGYVGLQVSFYRGSECRSALSGKRTSTIFFECDSAVGYGRPEPDPIMKDIECMAIFTWKTNLTCKPSTSRFPIVSTSTTTTLAPVTTGSHPTSTTNGSDADSLVPPNSSKSSDASSHHSWLLSVTVCVLAVALVAAFTYTLFRSTRGRRIYERFRRSFYQRGDQVFILDDHL